VTFSFDAIAYMLKVEQVDIVTKDQSYAEVYVDLANAETDDDDGITRRSHSDSNVRFRRSEKSVRTDCFYRGNVVGVEEATVTLTTCDGLRLAIISSAGQTLEVNSRDGTTAYGYRMEEKTDDHGNVLNVSCGTHEPEPSPPRHRSRRSLKNKVSRREDCASKTLELLLIGDSSQYDIHEVHTALMNLEIFNVIQGLFAVGAFACPIHIHLVGQLIFRNSMPDALAQSPSGNGEYAHDALLDMTSKFGVILLTISLFLSLSLSLSLLTLSLPSCICMCICMRM
jgi:hypothetical protein